MTSRFARAIVRQYPAAWRERYEDEILGLLDDSRPRVSDVVELTRGLFVERAKSLIEPAEHPTLTDWGFRSVAGLINIAPAVTLVVGGAALGAQLAAWFGEPPEVVPLIAVACAFVVLIADIGARRVLRVELSRAVNWGLVFATALFSVMWYWSRTPSASVPADFQTTFSWAQLFIWTTVAHRLLGLRLPWRPMFDAVERYQEALMAVRDAQSEVNRCRAHEQWHLPPALEILAQRKRERDEAKALVDTYGYRARFRR